VENKEMESNSQSPKTKPLTSKGDKIEVIKVLALMIVSFVVGFTLVILFLRPDSGDDEPGDLSAEPPVQTPPGVAGEPAAEPQRYAPTRAGTETATSADGADERDAPPPVPPGRTPEGVALDGSAFYLKCWDADGVESPGASCGQLGIFEKRFGTRLYVVSQCVKRQTDGPAEGKLSVGVEIDFNQMSLTFWNGASSTLAGADKIAGCLRSELAGLPIDGFKHKYDRYRLFFTVLFGPRAVEVREQAKIPVASPDDLKKGRQVDVIKDRVRVRRAPKDGAVFGRISSGNQVRLLKEEAGWCKIITPNNNQGWIICDALAQ
jgi:hypothetical protein